MHYPDWKMEVLIIKFKIRLIHFPIPKHELENAIEGRQEMLGRARLSGQIPVMAPQMSPWGDTT